MSNYPPLRLAALNQLADLKQQMLVHSDYLQSPDCPYDNETKDLLHNLLDRETVEVIVEKQVGGGEKAGRGRPSKDIRLTEEDQQLVLDGIKKTIVELDEMISKAEDTGERIQIAKTRTTLLDQLLKMQERHTAIAKMGQFVEDVVNILNDLGDEKDRETMLSRLEQYR
jgi:predicted ArsR family transcriptional regulator